MNKQIKVTCQAVMLAIGMLGVTAAQAQGPTLIDPVMVVESDNLDSVMVAEWLVTNATESAMTLSVQRNVIQTVDPFNLPYEIGAGAPMSASAGAAPAIPMALAPVWLRCR